MRTAIAIALAATAAGCQPALTAKDATDCIEATVLRQRMAMLQTGFSGNVETADEYAEGMLSDYLDGHGPANKADGRNFGVLVPARGWEPARILFCHRTDDGTVRAGTDREWQYEEGAQWQEVAPGYFLRVDEGQEYVQSRPGTWYERSVWERLQRDTERGRIEQAERDRQRRIAQEQFDAWARGEQVEEPTSESGR